jgi:ABC-type lipoprotein release transport system permease subunit
LNAIPGVDVSAAAVVALLAVWLAGMRAGKIDPMQALRAE